MKILNKKAFSVLEFTILLIIVIGGLVVMRSYIQRGIFSAWQQSGQTFGFGRQYDSQKTIECSFDDQYNQWYDRNCYEALRAQYCSSGDPTCEEGQVITCITPTCQQVGQ